MAVGIGPVVVVKVNKAFSFHFKSKQRGRIDTVAMEFVEIAMEPVDIVAIPLG